MIQNSVTFDKAEIRLISLGTIIQVDFLEEVSLKNNRSIDR